MGPLGPALGRFVLRRGVRIARSNQPEGNYQCRDQKCQQTKLSHGIVENRLVFFHHFRQFGCENQNAPNYGDQSHNQEGARLKQVLAKRNLHRVQDFGKDIISKMRSSSITMLSDNCAATMYWLKKTISVTSSATATPANSRPSPT